MESEKVLERKLVKMVALEGGKAIKFISQNFNGVPDRLVVFPQGRAVFVEMKSTGKKLRPLQLKRKQELEALGFKVYVIDSSESLQKFIAEMR